MNVSERCKSLTKKLILSVGMLRAASAVRPRFIAILKYHSIRDDPDLVDDSIGSSIVHRTDVFREQMELVARQFNPVTMDDVALFLRGQKEAPKWPVAVTFDDGYADNCEVAAPLLRRVGVPATFYVTVDAVDGAKAPWFVRVRHAIWTTKRNSWLDVESGRTLNLEKREDRISLMRRSCRRCASLTGHAQEEAVRAIEAELEAAPYRADGLMMSWGQIGSLQSDGHAIGSHTLSHPNVAHVSSQEMRVELVESKRRLEGKLGVSVKHLSYPHPCLNPNFSAESTAVAREAGYATAVLSINGPVSLDSDPMSMERLAVASDRHEFLWNLECTLLGRRV